VDAFAEIIHGQTSSTAKVIADAAKQLEADVIVVGTRGHGPITGLIVGSVTHRLLHLAPCPVLVVPPAKGSAKARSEREHAVTAG
jgi:nucleotide-binding universal stress UspA family protein